MTRNHSAVSVLRANAAKLQSITTRSEILR
jgi:hypothetical protein